MKIITWLSNSNTNDKNQFFIAAEKKKYMVNQYISD